MSNQRGGRGRWLEPKRVGCGQCQIRAVVEIVSDGKGAVELTCNATEEVERSIGRDGRKRDTLA